MRIALFLLIIVINGKINPVLCQFNQSCIAKDLCLNNGICEERPFTKSGYSCKCTDEYQGFHCENKLPEVKCLSDRIILTVEKSLLMAEFNTAEASFVYLGNGRYLQNECVSQDTGSDLVITLQPPFTECGTASSSEGSSVVYKNRMFLDTTHSSKVENGLRMVFLDWSCVYPTNYKVSYHSGLQPGVNRPEQKTAYGKFTLNLKIFQSEDFSEATLLRPPAVLAVGQPVFAQIELMTSAYRGLAVTIISCVASNVADPTVEDSMFSHQLVENGCPNWQDTTVQIFQSETSKKAQFSFQMFMWSTEPAPVYLHCLVSVCNVTKRGRECQSNCDDDTSLFGERKRRELNAVEETPDLRLTIGPFLIDTESTFVPLGPKPVLDSVATTISFQEKNRIDAVSSKPPHIITGILVGMGIVALIAVSLALLRHSQRLSTLNNFLCDKLSSGSNHARTRSSNLSSISCRMENNVTFSNKSTKNEQFHSQMYVL